jgi:superfamily I DNA/RNA helicase
MHMADVLDINIDNGFRKFGDIAILYRTQSQGRYLYEQLMKRGYPCQMSVPDSFWEKREIVDFLEGVESLIEWTDIALIKDKFSEWIAYKINKFIESQHLTKLQVGRLERLIPHTVVFDHLPISEALTRLLDEARTVQDADNLAESDKINLLTLHAAKGLEFPVVMIFGLEEGNIPHKKLKDDPYWLAEERRLMYVGMTRASDALHIFSAKQDDGKILEPSRFLKEIGHENLIPGVIPEVKIRQIHKQEVKKAQMKLF